MHVMSDRTARGYGLDMSDEREAADKVRLILMEMNDALMVPWREWLAGAVSYFSGQGFTDEQARAMAAAEYTTVLGNRIENSATRTEDD